MGIKKTRLLAHKLVYWMNMNADIKNTVKQYATCLNYQKTQPHWRMILHEILCKPWEAVGADIFLINNDMLLCIVHYYSKFCIFKKGDGFQLMT